MTKKSCCYVINPSYILPALVSARQIRSFMKEEETDINISCLNGDWGISSIMKGVCSDAGIQYRDFDAKTIDNQPIMFGRFFLDRLLNHDDGAALYLDGDTQIVASLAPLLDIAIEQGKFIAARDPMSILLSSRNGVADRQYFASIGILAGAMSRYLNSGVLRLNLNDVREIGKNVLGVAAGSDRPFRFPDQDPLNLAYGNDYLTMSYRWNFPAFFFGAKLQEVVAPRICHFMSDPRPWDGPMLPWGPGWSQPYSEILRSYPALKPFAKQASYMKYTKYIFQQYYKKIFEIPSWTTDNVRNRILAVEHQCYV